jgi:hypothetical protein
LKPQPKIGSLTRGVSPLTALEIQKSLRRTKSTIVGLKETSNGKITQANALKKSSFMSVQDSTDPYQLMDQQKLFTGRLTVDSS